MSNFSYEALSLHELQSIYSDFFKDFYGFRPRGIDLSNWENREWMIYAINGIHDRMDALKETFEGREELRRSGWVVEEADPELQKRADSFRKLRETCA
jgi:hypothetical protein